MREILEKLLRYIIDVDGNLGTSFAQRLFASSLDDKYFYAYDASTHSFHVTAHAIIFDFCRAYYDVFKYAPTDTVISMELSSRSDLPLVQRTEIDGIISNIRFHQANPAEFEYIWGQINDEFVRTRAICIRAKATDLSRTDPVGAVDYEMRELQGLKSQSSIYETTDEKSLAFYQFMEWQYEKFVEGGELLTGAIPFGYDEWDRAFGGMYPGNLIVICGGSGVGKSWIGHDIAYNCGLDLDKKVVVADREMLYDQLALRLLARITGIPMRKLRSKHNLTKEEHEIVLHTLDLMRQVRDRNLLFVPPNKCVNPTMLSREIDMHFGGEKPDLIMVDYIEEMEPTIKVSGWEASRDVTAELKSMSIKYHCPVLTMTQNNAQGMKAEDPGLEAVSNKATYKKADTFIMISEDPERPYVPPIGDSLEPGTPGILLARFIKNRNEAKNVPFRLEVEFATASIKPATRGFGQTAIGRSLRMS